MPYKDPETRKTYHREYYRKNRERINRLCRERFKQKTPEEKAKIRARRAKNSRRWREDNPRKYEETRRRSEMNRRERAGVRERRLKVTHIIAMGGKCMFCGYDTSIAALEFHHLDPSEKEGRRVIEARWEEMDYSKFLLLCSNCHRELHAKMRSGSLTPYALAPDVKMVSSFSHVEKE